MKNIFTISIPKLSGQFLKAYDNQVNAGCNHSNTCVSACLPGKKMPGCPHRSHDASTHLNYQNKISNFMKEMMREDTHHGTDEKEALENFIGWGSNDNL